jgi:hypothetical protein
VARLYSNENFPRPVVEALRAAGHDVLTSHDAGNANRKVPDDQVLAFATAERRAVLTLNRRDFIRLHRSGVVHEGIIACTADADYPAQAERIHRMLCASPHISGQLIRVNKP